MSEPIELQPGRAFPLGAVCDGTGTNFAVASEVAEAAQVCLFDAAANQTAPAEPEFVTG